MRGIGKEGPHLSRCEQAGDGIPVVQVDNAFLHNTGDKVAKVTFRTMVDNSSGQMVAGAVQKKGHDKFVERFLLKSLESFGVTGEMVRGRTRGRRKKRQPSNAYVERAHQSVEAMVRTMTEVTEDKTNQIERHRKHHELNDSTRSILANTLLLEKTAKHHQRDDITKITQASFCHLDRLLMRKSETRTLNVANSIPDSFQAFGLEKPQRAMSTLSEQHTVYTQQRSVRAKNDQEIWNSGLVKSMKGTPVGTAGRGQSNGSSDVRGTAQTNDRLEHQHKNSQRFVG